MQDGGMMRGGQSYDLILNLVYCNLCFCRCMDNWAEKDFDTVFSKKTEGFRKRDKGGGLLEDEWPLR